MRLLLARDDVKVDAKDKNGRTPLSFAAEWGSEEGDAVAARTT